MLDPRSIAVHRDEIAESCRRRGVTADVDAASALQTEVAAKQTELNEANRRRNEHQQSGKQNRASPTSDPAGCAMKAATGRPCARWLTAVV